MTNRNQVRVNVVHYLDEETCGDQPGDVPCLVRQTFNATIVRKSGAAIVIRFDGTNYDCTVIKSNVLGAHRALTKLGIVGVESARIHEDDAGVLDAVRSAYFWVAPVNAFKRGDRVVWSFGFLETGRKQDPRWYEEHKDQVGTVDWIQRDGDVLVKWDDSDDTTIHPPERLALWGTLEMEEGT